jgi:hypothetical protein
MLNIKQDPRLDFLKKSLIESYNQSDSMLINLGKNEIEKEGIHLMLMNKDLNGLVMLDGEKV